MNTTSGNEAVLIGFKPLSRLVLNFAIVLVSYLLVLVTSLGSCSEMF